VAAVGVDIRYVVVGAQGGERTMAQTQTLGDPGGKLGDLCRRLDGLSQRQLTAIRDLLDAFADR